MTEAIEVLTTWCDEHTNTLEPIAMAKDLALTLRDAGFAVVPVEPTDRMWLAGDAEFLHSVNSIWRAMVAAAQGGVE